MNEEQLIKKLKKDGYWDKNDGWENGFVEEALRIAFKEGIKYGNTNN